MSSERLSTPTGSMSSRWPVIDTHFHIGVNRATTFIAEEDLLPWMNKAHIDIQIVFQFNVGYAHRTPAWNPYIGNDYVAKIQKMFPKRVIGLAHINPWLGHPSTFTYGSRQGQKFDLITVNPALEEIERAIVGLKLGGIKIHPVLQGCAVNNPGIMHPLMDRLNDLQQKSKRNLMVVVHAMGDSLWNSPEAVADLAKAYPQLLFIMAHSGFLWGGSTLAHTVGSCENVMFDLTTCCQKSVVLPAYKKYGPERFTAGTDGPFASASIKMAIINDIFKDPREKELVLGGNLAKYLGIPKIPE